MVTVATNTGQSLRHHHSGADGDIYAVDLIGSTPISSIGEKTTRPTVVSLDGREVVRIYLKNGSWELLYEGGRYYLACDTEGIEVELPALGAQVSYTPAAGGEGVEQLERQPFTYPRAFELLQIKRG
jgi:hypothetical protein